MEDRQSQNKAQHYIDKGVNVRIVNFDDEESLEQAMKGIAKVLLIPAIAPQSAI
ncbi:hypothetical protein [Chitinophaga sp. LS1]|uniref:hypothetical protein n=1 Tax=Chitinophaga sp. LS1 TaxID=3051176 RepID=UPI002AABDAF9|nr:hypothetical protein [Chitinophaga sp. LS1]WPV63773.1 hypothetical protein QQL36_18410 [Chitinophaga sp. LS1]